MASAVLIRAVEPVVGMDLMRRRRGSEVLRELTRGPARLCEAFAVDRQLDGWDLVRGQRIWIAEDTERAPADFEVGVSPRIGVAAAHSLDLRFFMRGNCFVSGPQSVAVRRS